MITHFSMRLAGFIACLATRTLKRVVLLGNPSEGVVGDSRKELIQLKFLPDKYYNVSDAGDQENAGKDFCANAQDRVWIYRLVIEKENR